MIRKEMLAMSILVLILVTSASVSADVPRIINYQGRLTDTAGVPYTGAQLTKFTIYDISSSAVWNSGFITVNYDDGLFDVQLGQSPQPALPASLFSSDTGLALGVTVDVNPEFTPRTRLATVAYAMHAKDAEKLGGLDASTISASSGWYDSGPVVGLITSADRVLIGQLVPSSPSNVFEAHALGGSNTAGYFESDGTGPFYNGILVKSTSADGTAGMFVHGTGANSSIPKALSASTTTNNAFAMQSYTSGDNSFNHYANHWGTGGAAIYGWSDRSYAGYFTSGGDGKGIYAESDSSYGGEFMTDFGNTNATGVYGHFDYVGTVDGKGVFGRSVPADYYGLGGIFEGGYVGANAFVNASGSNSYYGVYGTVSGTGGGIRYGVRGEAGSGAAGTKYGVYGLAYGPGTNYGVYSDGNCNVTGTLTKALGAFKIDHPLDPENKYLQHSFVESPDMMNIYNGIVEFENSGRAVVTMPDWFDALNKDFRFQLTCIGGYAPVYIESEVKNGAFVIAGGQPGLKVSWQVTGIRQDAYAKAHPIEVELIKAVDEKGLYAHPDVFGQKETKGIDYVRRNKDLDAHPEKKAALEAMRNSKPPVHERPVVPAPSELLKIEEPSNK